MQKKGNYFIVAYCSASNLANAVIPVSLLGCQLNQIQQDLAWFNYSSRQERVAQWASYECASDHPRLDFISDKSRKQTFKEEKRITCPAAFNWLDQCCCTETMSGWASVFMRLFRLHGARTSRRWERCGLCVHELWGGGLTHLCVWLHFCHLNTNTDDCVGWTGTNKDNHISVELYLKNRDAVKYLKFIFFFMSNWC